MGNFGSEDEFILKIQSRPTAGCGLNKISDSSVLILFSILWDCRFEFLYVSEDKTLLCGEILLDDGTGYTNLLKSLIVGNSFV